MTFAHQADEAFEYSAPVTYYAAQQYLLSDRKFGSRRRKEFLLDTGLDEAPRLVLTVASSPTKALIDQLQHVVDRLKELKMLETGWNSYNAAPVRRETIAPALRITLAALLKCKSPRIEANSEGGIDLIWEEADKDLTVSVNAMGQFEVLYQVLGQDVEEPDSAVDFETARSFLDRFCTAQ